MTSLGGAAVVSEVEQLLRDAVEGRHFGGVEVRKLIALLGEDADNENAVYVNLVLSDPEGPTWSVDDVQALRREVRQLLVAHPPGVPFYVTLRPEHEGPQADEGQEEARNG